MRQINRQTVEMLERQEKDKKMVLWGFEPDSIQKVMEQHTNLDCIIDSNSELWGMPCGTLKIYPPEHLYALNPETHFVLVTAKANNVYNITREIEAIDQFEVFYFNVIFNKFFCFFSNQLYDQLEKIEKIKDELVDDRSKKIYREVVYRRIMGAIGGFNNLKTRDCPQYIYPPMYAQMNEEEVFIDCGGYIGDSVDRFITDFGKQIKKIYSFECFEENILKLQEKQEFYASKWNGELVIVPYAVSDKNGKETFNDIGRAESGYLPENRLTVEYNEKLAPVKSYEVETVKLDDFIPAEEKITLIKMDIEGAEYAALKGAEKLIRKYKPRLAISIYHNPCDYWRIYELIHQFSEDYKFAVRHHQNNHLDTVLYAWTEDV